jgi:hypothetical protein
MDAIVLPASSRCPSPDFLPAARSTMKGFFTQSSAPESQKSGVQLASDKRF